MSFGNDIPLEAAMTWMLNHLVCGLDWLRWASWYFSIMSLICGALVVVCSCAVAGNISKSSKPTMH